MKFLSLIIGTVLFWQTAAEARQFLVANFAMSARYENMPGRKAFSETPGFVRISDDKRFCAVDIPALKKTIPCTIRWVQTVLGTTSAEIRMEPAAAVDLSRGLVRTVQPWPAPLLKRFDELIQKLPPLALSDFSGFDSDLQFQLDDTAKADAVHMRFFMERNQWKPY